MKHALVKLGQAIDWRFLEERVGAVYTDKPGQPPLPTRLMAGLAILKHTYEGIEQQSGSPNYGYRPATSDDRNAAFPAPLTESIAHRIAMCSYNRTAGKRRRRVAI
jgi:hypothetical protein